MRGPELFALIQDLLANPASRFHAAVAGWSYPITRAEMILLDQNDYLLMRWSEQGKYKPSARPWDAAKPSGPKRSVAEAMAILRPHRKSPVDS